MSVEKPSHDDLVTLAKAEETAGVVDPQTIASAAAPEAEEEGEAVPLPLEPGDFDSQPG